MRFASFLSGEFTTMAVINPPERKLTKRTSVQYYEPLGFSDLTLKDMEDFNKMWCIH